MGVQVDDALIVPDDFVDENNPLPAQMYEI